MADKDIDINSEIVLAIADLMEASNWELQKKTEDFKKNWDAVKGSFDDTSKKDIEQVIFNTTAQIDDLIRNQQASHLMRKYVETLRGGAY